MYLRGSLLKSSLDFRFSFSFWCKDGIVEEMEMLILSCYKMPRCINPSCFNVSGWLHI